MQKRKNNGVRKGTTLIEVLVALFVFSVMTLTFYEVFTIGLVQIGDAQRRLQAMALATEQMEKIRNLAYEDVGFASGVPVCVVHCVLVPEEEKSLGNGVFHILTSIQYRDDATDGTLAAHTDAIPTDYKRVTIRVEWGDRSDGRRVEMTSRFVPPGMEQSIPNTGALSVNISDYAARGVENARVEITGVAGNFFTDDTGNVFLLGVPVNAGGYAIRITKSGYETVATLPYPPTGAFPPKNAPVAVSNGAINVGNFELNPLTDLTLQTEDPFGNTISGVNFSMTGGQRLDNNYATPQYECMDEAHVSDGDGTVSITNRSGGRYVLALTGTSAASYVLWKTSVPSDVAGSALVPYGGSVSEKVILIRKDTPGILVRVTNATGGMLPGASVHVTSTVPSYDETQVSDAYGYAYFPETEHGIAAGASYTVHVEVDGYAPKEETATPTNLQEVSISLHT